VNIAAGVSVAIGRMAGSDASSFASLRRMVSSCAMLGAPSALGSMIASGRASTTAATSAAVIWPSSGLTRTSVTTAREPAR